MNSAPRSSPHARAAGRIERVGLSTAIVLGLATGLAQGQGVGKATGAQRSRPQGSAPALNSQREAAALEFVRTHHPELAALLAQLQPMRPDEYARAMDELAQVGRNIADVATRDPKRSAIMLEAWKARSRVELLTAKLASDPSPDPDPALRERLREAIAAQIAVQTRQLRAERDQAEARLKRLEQNLKRLEANPSGLAEAQYQALWKKSQRMRKPGASASAKVTKPSSGGASDDSRPMTETSSKGDR